MSLSPMFPPSRRGKCRPCRELNLQCDENKPRCGECVSSNKICGGYDLGNVFINMNATGPPPVFTRSRNAQKYLVVDVASQPSFAGSSRPSSTQPMSDPTLLLQDWDNTHEVTMVFLDHYYRRFGPDKTSSEPLQAGNECGGWRALLPEWIGISPILDTAIKALGICFIGSQYRRDERLLDRGRNIYLEALQMLQPALIETKPPHRKELLATTLVLSSVEHFLSNGCGAPSQRTHIEGASRLLQCIFNSPCPEQSLDSNPNALFIFVLNLGLFVNLATRRPYVFASPTYRPLVHRLYTSHPAHRTSLYFQLCESVLPLTDIVAAVDALAATPTSSSNQTTIDNTLDNMGLLDQALSSWHDSLKSTTPGPWTMSTAIPVATPSSVPFPLHYTTIESCTLHCLFWTFQILLLDARKTLSSLLPDSQDPPALPPPNPNVDLDTQIAEYASLICRSVEFCAKGRSFAAAENMLFPLEVVRRWYEKVGDEDRMGWCVRTVDTIAEEQGWGVGGGRGSG